MRIGEICIRDVVCAERSTSVREAARLMRSHHVGDVVVVEKTARGRTPIGIITDRDIAVGIIAAEIDPSDVVLGDIIYDSLITAPEDQNVFETVEQMRRHGIRRLPVVDSQSFLVGIITLDDLQEFLGMQLAELSKAVGRERTKELEMRL